MPTPRTILHVDLDAFFCAVEELLNPDLHGKAFVVAGSPQARGVVASASYPARKFGIRSAMPTARAVRLCPELIVVSHRHRTYGDYSRRVMDVMRQNAPMVEQISVDEAFLDVSDDRRGGLWLAKHLKAKIREGYGLPTSWGVASNKLVAKIATEVGKPDGLVVVPHGLEAEFLAPLPVQMLWGVGPKTLERLAGLGVTTIGDLAAVPAQSLTIRLGERGPDLAARARGEDHRPVVAEHEPKSMSAETTFERDISDPQRLAQTLLRLSEEVGRRLREDQLAGRTVKIKVRWPDFTTLTRQTRLAQATDQDGEIYQAAHRMMEAVWQAGKAVRLLGVGVSDLGPLIRQLSLFDAEWERDERLLRAIDQIRGKYGRSALQRAAQIRQAAPDEDVSRSGEPQDHAEPPGRASNLDLEEGSGA
jgi:DNA polymerase IV